MFLLFFFSFSAANIMLIETLIRSIAVHSGACDCYDSSRYARMARRIRLRRHWLITLLLFAVACYAGINL